MNGRPWLPHELAWLREWYGVRLVEDMAATLKRGVPGVRSKILELGLFCRTRWTPELDEFISLLYPDTPSRAIAQAIGVTRAALFARCSQLGVKKEPAFAAENARQTTLERSRFTPEIAATIERLYPTTHTTELSHLIGIPVSRIHAYARKHGWGKTPEFVRETARARSGPDHPMRRSQFQKGAVPPNKGVKGWQAGGRSRETQFKKGTVPYTWKPIGSYRVNADGYLDRKVSDTGYPPRDWQAVHRLVWIEANGPIPDGHVVSFKPGLKTSQLELITLDRIECVSKADIARRNAWHSNLPPDLKELMGARIALSRAINRKQKELEHGHE